MKEEVTLEQWEQGETPAPINLEQMDDLVQKYRDARDRYDALKKQSTAAYAEVAEMEKLVVNALQSSKRSKYEVEGVALVYITNKETYTTPKTTEDKQKLFDYIEGKFGRDTLMGMLGINHQTLNSWANQESEAGVMQIPGLALPTSEEILNMRRKS